MEVELVGGGGWWWRLSPRGGAAPEVADRWHALVRKDVNVKVLAVARRHRGRLL